MRTPDALAAIEALTSRADYEYFFSQIDSPDWLPHLVRAGYFRHPPGMTRKGDAFSFPPWPELHYLIRVASRVPAKVTRLLRALPSSDNARIHADVLEAASLMPARYAAAVVRNEMAWLRAQEHYLLIFPDTIEKLVGILSSAHAQLGRTLLATVLSVGPDPAPETQPFHPQPRTKLDKYDYARVVARALPSATAADGPATIALLVRLLRQAVRHSRKTSERQEDDYSYFWHDHFSDNIERADEPREALANALALASIAESSKSAKHCELVFGLLARGRTLLFRRLELYVLSRVSSAPSSLCSRILVRKGELDDARLRNERFSALSTHFGHLEPSDQNAVLAWIDVGPNTAQWREDVLADGSVIDSQTIDRWVRQWKRDRLALLHDHLSLARRKQLAELVESLGPAETDHRPYKVVVGWGGAPSPIPLDVLRALDVPSVAARVREWKPDSHRMHDSVDGLTAAIGEVAAERAAEFSSHINEFLGLDRLVVSRVIQSLNNAVKQGRAVDWQPLIAFLKRAAQEALDSTDDQSRWLCKVIADLLDDSLRSESVAIPIAQRGRVWEVIEVLCRHQDPTPEPAESFGDPYTHAINTVRGKALEAVIDYAFWCHRTADPAALPPVAIRITAPEVAERLHIHLIETNERSTAVRAVFGARLPNLFWLDREWVSESIQLLLPSPENDSALKRASLWAFIRWAGPGTLPFALLRPAFVLAVESLSSDSSALGEERGLDRLAEHLMVWMWRGEFAPDATDAILSRFFEKSSSRARAHAFEFIGRSLRNSTDSPPSEVVERIQSLWDWRWAQIRAATNPGCFSDEVSGFAWIAGSEHVAADWALDRLLSALRSVPAFGVELPVMERLASLASTHPLEVTSALSIVLLQGTDHPSYWIRHEEVATIAANVRASADAEANAALRDLVDSLMALGHFDAAELLAPERRAQVDTTLGHTT